MKPVLSILFMGMRQGLKESIRVFHAEPLKPPWACEIALQEELYSSTGVGLPSYHILLPLSEKQQS